MYRWTVFQFKQIPILLVCAWWIVSHTVINSSAHESSRWKIIGETITPNGKISVALRYTGGMTLVLSSLPLPGSWYKALRIVHLFTSSVSRGQVIQCGCVSHCSSFLGQGPCVEQLRWSPNSQCALFLFTWRSVPRKAKDLHFFLCGLCADSCGRFCPLKSPQCVQFTLLPSLNKSGKPQNLFRLDRRSQYLSRLKKINEQSKSTWRWDIIESAHCPQRQSRQTKKTTPPAWLGHYTQRCSVYPSLTEQDSYALKLLVSALGMLLIWQWKLPFFSKYDKSYWLDISTIWLQSSLFGIALASKSSFGLGQRITAGFWTAREGDESY